MSFVQKQARQFSGQAFTAQTIWEQKERLLVDNLPGTTLETMQMDTSMTRMGFMPKQILYFCKSAPLTASEFWKNLSTSKLKLTPLLSRKTAIAELHKMQTCFYFGWNKEGVTTPKNVPRPTGRFQQSTQVNPQTIDAQVEAAKPKLTVKQQTCFVVCLCTEVAVCQV